MTLIESDQKPYKKKSCQGKCPARTWQERSYLQTGDPTTRQPCWQLFFEFLTSKTTGRESQHCWAGLPCLWFCVGSFTWPWSGIPDWKELRCLQRGLLGPRHGQDWGCNKGGREVWRACSEAKPLSLGSGLEAVLLTAVRGLQCVLNFNVLLC